MGLGRLIGGLFATGAFVWSVLTGCKNAEIQPRPFLQTEPQITQTQSMKEKSQTKSQTQTNPIEN